MTKNTTIHNDAVLAIWPSFASVVYDAASKRFDLDFNDDRYSSANILERVRVEREDNSLDLYVLILSPCGTYWHTFGLFTTANF